MSTHFLFKGEIMNKKIIIRFVVFYLLTVILGTLSHFAFSFFNLPMFFKPIFPVNESTFEHLKLFFYPFMIFTIIEGFIYDEKLNYFIPKRGFIISFIMLFEILYISLMTKIFGTNSFINISSYYILMLVAFIISYYLNIDNKVIKIGGYINIALWIIIFFYFTSYPLDSLIFIDPSKAST